MATENKYENTLKTLDYYGEKIVKDMKGILKKRGKRATGRLINSIDFDIYKLQGYNRWTLEIEYAPYGKFVDGKPKPPRWNKGKGPPVQAIKNWLWAKNIPYRHRGNGKKPNRKKQIDIMAYLIVRKIKIRRKLNPLYNNPTNFTKAYDEVVGSQKYKKDLRKAIVKDAKLNLKRK